MLSFFQTSFSLSLPLYNMNSSSHSKSKRREMSFSDNDEFYLRRQPASSFLNKASLGPTQQQSSSVAMATDASKPCFKPTASSWPILLAVVPTVGSFFGGNADTWSDFVIILLVLYYIYKWMTCKYYTTGTRHHEGLMGGFF